jgi:membrane protein DedA with SNARE-associated domain
LVLAGYLKYNVFLTSIAVFIGTFVYAYGFAYLGSEIGLNWEQIKKMMDMINNILAIVTILVIGFLAYKNRQKIKKFLNLKSTK